MSKRLDLAIATGLLFTVGFTALAYGTVEAWSVAVFEFLVTALVVLWAAKAVADKHLSVNIPALALPLGAFFLFGLAQSVALTGSDGTIKSLSMDVEATRRAVTVIFFLFVAFLVAANFFTTAKRLRGLAIFLTLYGLGMAVFALVQHFAWDGRFFWIRPTKATVFGSFVNRNHFAGYMEMLVPVPLALIISRGAGEGRLIYGFATALMGTSIAISQSRGGIISLACELIFIALMSKRVLNASRPQRGNRSEGTIRTGRRFAAVGIVAVLILSGTVWWLGLAPIAERFGQIIDDVSGSNANENYSRAGMWRDTLALVRANAVTGTGIGAFETVYPQYGQSDGTLRVDYAHNDYLQVLADSGIVGGIIALSFIVLIGFAMARATRSRDPFACGLALGLSAGILGLLVHSLFDFNLQIPSNALLFLVLAGVLAHLASTVDVYGSETTPEPASSVAAGFVTRGAV